jgi:putative ATPase
MPAVQWYRPTERGLEGRIKEKLRELRQLDESSDKKRK